MGIMKERYRKMRIIKIRNSKYSILYYSLQNHYYELQEKGEVRWRKREKII